MLHTRLRPHCKEFLEKIAKLYELHVFTFGSRLYAHTIAGNRLDYLRLLFLSADALVPSAHVHKRVVSAEVCLSSGGLQKRLRIIMSAAGTIFNLSALNTHIKFNTSSSFFIIIPLYFDLGLTDTEV